MRILAIETVGAAGSVAALQDERLLVERPLDPTRRSAQTLAPAIAALLAEVGWQRQQIELVAVATGPGSFTGLRIGVTTAKTLAYALDCLVAGVHSLVAIAQRAPQQVDRLTAVLDAQRGELYAATLGRNAGGDWSGAHQTRVVERDAWLSGLEPGSIVSGPGLVVVGSRLPEGVSALPASLWNPTAGSVGAAAVLLAAAGTVSTAMDLVPCYIRRTAAEENWDRRHPQA